MGRETKIPWCDSTVNPVVGCDGCELHRAGAAKNHCYAASLVGRYQGLPGWPSSFDKPEFFSPHRASVSLVRPHWQRPSGETLAERFSANDLSWRSSRCIHGIHRAQLAWDPPGADGANAAHLDSLHKTAGRARQFFEKHACPANLWLLTTVTGPATVNRVAELLRIPGVTVRGISLEPMLEPVDLSACGATGMEVSDGEGGFSERAADWLILGGESGPGARPMGPEWARTVRDQCIRESIPFFFKAWGSQARGCLLDCREWHQMPLLV